MGFCLNAEDHSNKFLLFDKFDSKSDNIEIFIYFSGKKFLGKHINFYL